MTRRKQPRNSIQGSAEIVSVARLDCPGVHRHPNLEPADLGETIASDRLLCIERRRKGAGWIAEDGTESITNRLEYAATGRSYGRSNKCVMPRQCGPHGFRRKLPS